MYSDHILFGDVMVSICYQAGIRWQHGHVHRGESVKERRQK